MNTPIQHTGRRTGAARHILRAGAMVFAALVVLFVLPATGQAQQEPPMPPPIKALADGGAQLRYLGRHNTLDGWIAIERGQEQYFYVTPDGKSLLMGVLFDADGTIVTIRQVQELQKKSGDVLNSFIEPLPPTREGGGTGSAFKTPAEQLYEELEKSNWVAIGHADAPVIYTFIDPQCPHCKAFLGDLRKDYIGNNLLQVRAIPVGLRDETRAQAAFLLAAPNPQDRLYRYLDGDVEALPVTAGLNEQGVERNLALMQSWKFDVTPLTVYRAQNGQIKIIQGRAQNMADIMRDLGPPARP